MKIMSANRMAQHGTPRFAATHLGLFCLLMSHKKDTRLIWVYNIFGFKTTEYTRFVVCVFIILCVCVFQGALLQLHTCIAVTPSKEAMTG